jgi:AraC-like DNA-binding protein
MATSSSDESLLSRLRMFLNVHATARKGASKSIKHNDPEIIKIVEEIEQRLEVKLETSDDIKNSDDDEKFSQLVNQMNDDLERLENATDLERAEIQGDLFDVADQMSRLHTSKTSQLKNEIKVHLQIIKKHEESITKLEETVTTLQGTVSHLNQRHDQMTITVSHLNQRHDEMTKTLLIRGIISCLEYNLAEDIRRSDIKYRGKTFKHFHNSVFNPDSEKSNRINDPARRIYIDFLQANFGCSSKQFSYQFADYTKMLKSGGDTLAHPIPRPEEQDIELYKSFSSQVLELDEARVTWIYLLEVASNEAQKHHKTLIFSQ